MRRVLLLVGALLAACGSDDESEAGAGLVSCTVSTDAFDGTVLKLCSEVSGAAAAQVQQGCRSQSVSLPDGGPTITQRAEFRAGPCSHVGALGGCRTTVQGTTSTLWYYGIGDSGTGQTSEDIERLCLGIGAEFVPP